MLFVTDHEFERFVNLKRNRDLAHKFYRNGHVTRIHIDQDRSGHYKVQATVLLGDIMYYPVIYINNAGKITSASCDCHYGDEYTICAHVGAVLLALQELLPDHFPYDYRLDRQKLIRARQARQQQIAQERQRQMEESRRKFELAKRMEREQLSIDLTTDLRTQMMHTLLKDSSAPVSFEIILEPYLDSLRIRFKIGQEKKYFVKDLGAMIEAMEAHDYHSYGKYFSWVHDVHQLTDSGRQVYDFILHYFRSDYKSDVLLLNGSNCDAFYTLYKQNPEIFIFGNLFTIEEEPFKLSFQVQSDDRDVILSLLDKPSQYTLGRRHAYVMEADHLLMKIGDDEGICIKLIKMFHDYDKKLYIRHEQFKDFYRYALQPIEDHLVFSGDLPGHAEMTEDSIALYGDIDEDEVAVFDLYGIYGTTKINALENPDCSAKMELLLEYIRSYHPDEDGHHFYMDTHRQETMTFINEGFNLLQQYGDIYVSENLKKVGQKSTMKMQVGISVISDHLLSLDIDTFDFPKEELAGIIKSYRRKKKYYKLKNGELLHIQSDALAELDRIMQQYHLSPQEIHDGQIEMPISRAYTLNQTADDLTYLQVSRSESFGQVIKRLENYQSSNYRLNPHYDAILRDYQKQGFQWLSTMDSLNLGGILADDMGLGKTLQMIALLEAQKQRHTIVVTPASLILNWADELVKFSASLKALCVMGAQAVREKQITEHDQYDILITSYDYLKRDIDLYQDIVFDYIILDEAQYIKNQNTKNAQSVKQLKGRQRFALTGTPIENSLAELWSLFDFLNKDYLYHYGYFRKLYEIPIVKNHDEQKQAELRKMVAPFILRRKKNDVLTELPDKVEKTLTIDFSEDEAKIYFAHLAQARHELEGLDDQQDKIKIIAMLTKLRQICCEPRLLFDDFTRPSSKMQACIEMIETYQENNKKLIVFSSFKSVLDLIAEALNREQIKYHMLTGATGKKQRKEIVDLFQSDDSTVFLISLKAGGVGLNLTAAEGVIHFDPWWNMSAQTQATDRAHRIGQKNTVFVYKLIMRHSIEEKILKLQEAKADLVNTFVEDHDMTITNMSAEEIRALFT